MPNPIFWSNVGIDVQSALLAAVPVQSVTKANPGVVGYTGADPVNGDYVVFTSQGMNEIDRRVFRVANVNGAGNTFELEGEDTTGYNTFTGGSFQVITFGAVFDTVQNVNASGGEPEMQDLTTIHDSLRRRAPGIPTAASFAMTNFFAPSDPGWIECNKAMKAKATRAIRYRFASGVKMVFLAFASAPGVPTGQAQGVVQTPVNLEAQGALTTYLT